MKRRLLLLIIVAALGFGGYTYDVARRTRLGEQALAATQLEFLPFAQALQRAKAEGKPVLADFSAIWCPACRALHQTVFTDPAVRAAVRARTVLARIDYESPEAPAFMGEYSVSSFPTLLLIDSDGRLLRPLPTSLDPQALLSALR
jgi:thiol:disulfide interchange protein